MTLTDTKATLDWITVKGFKSISKIERLKLRPINVLIGPNGSGKSNFIGVFSLLNEIRFGRLQTYVGKEGGAEKILHYGSKNSDHVLIRIAFKNEVNQYEIELSPDSSDSMFPSREEVYPWNPTFPMSVKPEKGEARISKRDNADNDPLSVEIKSIQKHLKNWRRFHFHDTSVSSPLRKIADLHNNRSLYSDGTNLAAFLYLLRENYRSSYNQIQDTIKLVVPFFDKFDLKPMELNPRKILLEWRQVNSDAYFDSSSLSDGTLRFIALTTLLLQPKNKRPAVIVIDEPELGLHPYAITVLASLIKQASVDSQIVLATQSSLLLDHFEPEDVLIANRVNGATEFARLEANSLKDLLNEYSLGQLWEKNEFGGRPD